MTTLLRKKLQQAAELARLHAAADGGHRGDDRSSTTMRLSPAEFQEAYAELMEEAS